MVNPQPNLMLKFGVSGTDAAAVAATFNAIHQYLAGISAADLVADDSLIQLGDWIDLPSLTVAEYGTGGTYNTAEARGEFSITDPGAQANTEILRVIVVGRNSFNGITDIPENGSDPHLVFQFLHLPGKRRMEATGINTNGYLGSEMHDYLVGPYLLGLQAAGVPPNLLWAPSRRVANKGSGATAADTIADKIWLPTAWEMYGPGSAYETSTNQTRLEYYATEASRVKKDPANAPQSYWTASPKSDSTQSFRNVMGNGNATNASGSQNAGGCAPAFCVK